MVVLTDDERIATAVDRFGGECELTPVECTSGTDRVAWAARNWNGVAGIVNVQGDEPMIEPEAVARVARHLAEHPGDPMVTLAARDDPAILEDPNVVKVVTDRNGYALYFSRAAIPYPRLLGQAPVLRHVGVYGYQPEALAKMAGLEPTALEQAESLEQLRALENGIAIRVLETATASPGVDTAEDLARVEEMMRAAGERPAEPERGNGD